MIYEISTDGITVWVNAMGGLIGRFGKAGIDVHHEPTQQHEKGECLHCTHEPVTEVDWEVFKEKMLEHHSVVVPDRYKPMRFRTKQEVNA